jgi:hypothetical protein
VQRTATYGVVIWRVDLATGVEGERGKSFRLATRHYRLYPAGGYLGYAHDF